MNNLVTLVCRHFRVQAEELTFTPIGAGASGRTIVRIQWGDNTSSCMGVAWTQERADNDAFVPVARHLRRHGVCVPEIFDALETSPGCGAAITEDLGDVNLLSFRDEAWEARRGRYLQAMEQLRKLHDCPIPHAFDLQPAFDETLYRWEQEYFAEHFLGTHLGKDPQRFLNHPEVRSLAKRLAELPTSPIHRDAQSQNIHIFQGKTWLIDFQGMRLGRPEYDLASLLYDGYARLTAGQIRELQSDWEQLTGTSSNHDIFRDCALQRVMQMLGAFANIGHNKGKSWYLEQIPTGLAHLKSLLPDSSLSGVLAELLEDQEDQMSFPS